MLQSFSQSADWFSSEPLLFDDEFCQSLMKDLQALPTPPQSPPTKPGVGGAKPLSREDQLSYVSDILLEDHDLQLIWNCDFFHNAAVTPQKEGVAVASGGSTPPEEGVAEDCLWRCLEDKMATPLLGSSPLLSDIDTSIFQEIAGSTLDCQDLLEGQDAAEATSDYGSAGGELSTSSSSDSEEEIDVVTVVRCSSSPAPLPSLADRQKQEAELRALQRHHQEIHQQHNYAAPRPASPPPAKRSRPDFSSSRQHHSSRSSAPSSSSFSRHHHHHHHHHSLRGAAAVETEDEEERRRTHNVMERQRRNELKNCFVRLRENVPELSSNAKASKVLILKKARDAIHTLEGRSLRLAARRDRLRAAQEQLKARLQQLQQSRT